MPEGGGATGCGGEYESYVDAAINETLAYPKATGVTELSGNLFTGERRSTNWLKKVNVVCRRVSADR